MAGDPPYPYWMQEFYPSVSISLPHPRFVPVNMQMPQFGVTIATLDKDGNLTVKVDQPVPIAEPAT